MAAIKSENNLGEIAEHMQTQLDTQTPEGSDYMPVLGVKLQLIVYPGYSPGEDISEDAVRKMLAEHISETLRFNTSSFSAEIEEIDTMPGY